MQKIYLSAGCKGYLKPIDVTVKTDSIYGTFTKQIGMAKTFTSTEEAKDYQQQVLDYYKDILAKQTKLEKKAQYVKDNWNTFKDSEARSLYLNGKLSHWRLTNKEEYLTDKYSSYKSIVNDLCNTNKVCKIIAKLKAIESEATISFFPSKTTKLQWVDAPADIKSVGDRIYCNCCGGVIPNIRYLKLEPKSYHAQNMYLCAFCVNRLGGEVQNIVNNISDEVKDQYEADRFIQKL